MVRELIQSKKPAVGRKLIDLPGYVFRVFVTNRSDAALEIWRDYNRRAGVECRIDELKNELAADRFCLRSFFATESAFLAVLFSFKERVPARHRSSAQDLQTTGHTAFRSFYLWRHPRSKRASPGTAHVQKLGGVTRSESRSSTTS